MNCADVPQNSRLVIALLLLRPEHHQSATTSPSNEYSCITGMLSWDMRHLLASDRATRHSSLKPLPPKNERYVFFLYLFPWYCPCPRSLFLDACPAHSFASDTVGQLGLESLRGMTPIPMRCHVSLFVFMPLLTPPPDPPRAPLSLIPAPLASGHRTGSFPDMRAAAACSWRATTAVEQAVRFPPPFPVAGELLLLASK